MGDVWLCGGQSNMQFSLKGVRNGAEEVKAANDPNIRFFTVAPHTSYHRREIVEGKWNVVSPETAESVSAVGYYFARRVEQQIHVPIGMVVDALCGPPPKPGPALTLCAR